MSTAEVRRNTHISCTTVTCPVPPQTAKESNIMKPFLRQVTVHTYAKIFCDNWKEVCLKVKGIPNTEVRGKDLKHI